MLGKARSRARVAAAMAFAGALAGAFSLAPASRADELKLKDGTKITGVIVGFEENSFKVKTNYGFAIIQKDQVVSISISDAGVKSAAAKSGKSDASAPPSAPAPKESAAAKPAEPAPAANPAPKKSAAPPAAAASSPAATKPVAATPASSSSGAPAAAPASNAAPAAAATIAAPAAPPKPPAPEPIREVVSGNSYTNETYGFHMYKPPDWDVIQGAPAVLPGAITAMGTEDQTTYLLIGQNPVGKSLAADIDSTEQRLRETLENFRPLGDTKLTIAGAPAVERKFRGSVDNRDWSGVVVFIPRGTRLYTIFGMTLADTDLVQIQENVISRAISSLQFTQQ